MHSVSQNVPATPGELAWSWIFESMSCSFSVMLLSPLCVRCPPLQQSTLYLTFVTVHVLPSLNASPDNFAILYIHRSRAAPTWKDFTPPTDASLACQLHQCRGLGCSGHCSNACPRTVASMLETLSICSWNRLTLINFLLADTKKIKFLGLGPRGQTPREFLSSSACYLGCLSHSPHHSIT